MNIDDDNRQSTTSQNFRFSSYNPEDAFGLSELHRNVTHSWSQNIYNMLSLCGIFFPTDVLLDAQLR
jgi:hypothetical protein